MNGIICYGLVLVSMMVLLAGNSVEGKEVCEKGPALLDDRGVTVRCETNDSTSCNNACIDKGYKKGDCFSGPIRDGKLDCHCVTQDAQCWPSAD